MEVLGSSETASAFLALEDFLDVSFTSGSALEALEADPLGWALDLVSDFLVSALDLVSVLDFADLGASLEATLVAVFLEEAFEVSALEVVFFEAVEVFLEDAEEVAFDEVFFAVSALEEALFDVFEEVFAAEVLVAAFLAVAALEVVVLEDLLFVSEVFLEEVLVFSSVFFVDLAGSDFLAVFVVEADAVFFDVAVVFLAVLFLAAAVVFLLVAVVLSLRF